jgi:putative aldouronate transport system substrate-binding protein
MKRNLSLFLSLLLIVSIFAGCNSNPENTFAPSDTTDNTSPPQVSEAPDKNSDLDIVTYPLVDEAREFSFYHQVDAELHIQTNAENLFWSEMSKLTNINFNWIHPPNTSLSETFNLMIASQNYYDIIWGFSRYYTLGIDSAIDEDIIYSLDDYMQYTPNMYRWLESDEGYMLDAISDEGRFWGIYGIKSELQGPWAGPIIRADLLDKYNLDTPVSYDDWETFLTICRDQEGMTEGPLGISMFVSSLFGSTNSGYGVSSINSPWVNKEGTVVNTLLTEDYRNYITMMADWFEKGLINQDFMTEVVYYGGGVPKFANGVIGMGESTYDLSKYEIACPPEMRVEAIPLPVLNEGDTPKIRQSNTLLDKGASAVLSTNVSSDDDIILLCRFFDYMFTEAGQLLSNWGVEGITFEYDSDGKPAYTELITNNPDGLGFLQAHAIYLARNTLGVYEWTRELTPDILECMNIWLNATNEWVMPEGMSMTAEESRENSIVWGDCQTYIQEGILAFVTGGKPLSEWDSFIDQLMSMNIEKCTELRQIALDRYYDRLNFIS